MSNAGLMYRQTPAAEHAKRLVAGAVAGQITRYRGYFFAGYATDDPNGAPTGCYKREGAGLGVLGDIMSHAVDMARNPLAAIEASTSRTWMRGWRGGSL